MYDWNGILYTDKNNNVYINFDMKIGSGKKENILTKVAKLK